MQGEGGFTFMRYLVQTDGMDSWDLLIQVYVNSGNKTPLLSTSFIEH